MAKSQKLKKVLIANRGEIALRVQRACEKLGVESVSIASEVDKGSLFAREAKELVVVGPAPAHESYLNIDRIVQAAKDTGCDSVHPGYGFLSENAEFAARVLDSGLIFIGPDPKSIEILGSKTEARKAVSKNGVPCTPGSPGALSDKELLRHGKEIGFPVLIKAVGGGGGRGMRMVESHSDLKDQLPRARAEAKKNFGSEDVYLEKFIVEPRHVEVQVFGDSAGNLLHFGTRDCSTQRRHQKLVEEAPAPFLDPSLRERIHEAALLAARSVQYKNAGTVEFLVKNNEFYFLEMNTRIQVEHPVTEEVTGVDLVELQLRVASGESLPFEQRDITFSGHAIEFRIYAEDPEANFQPAIGKITDLERPELPFLRDDHGIERGDEVTPYYDAMLSKMIIRGADRNEVISRSKEALAAYRIEGLPTTIAFHKWLLYFSPFPDRCLDISYLNREFTRDCIRDVRASEVRDPKHCAPVGSSEKWGGAEVKNTYHYTSEKFGETYTIEILHRRDGFFLAIPVDSQGRRARNENCRMSNGLDAVVRSLITDVLEEKSPAELFAAAS